MLPKFEAEINSIIKIQNKRLLINIGCLIILSALTLYVFIVGFITYTLLLLLLDFLTVLILLINRVTVRKLADLIIKYHDNKEEVIDYLVILIRNYETNKSNNLYLKLSFKKIIKHYINAHAALIEEE